jgi:hypothetical protein
LHSREVYLAFGLAMSAADEEMSADDAAKVAKECAAYLEALVAK